MSSDEERRKREIFDGMSPKRQQRILEKGYESWDPFLPPKEPPLFSEADRRRHRGTADRVQRFLAHAKEKIVKTSPSPLYAQAVREFAFKLARGDERHQAMYDYCHWLIVFGEGGREESDSEER